MIIKEDQRLLIRAQCYKLELNATYKLATSAIGQRQHATICQIAIVFFYMIYTIYMIIKRRYCTFYDHKSLLRAQCYKLAKSPTWGIVAKKCEKATFYTKLFDFIFLFDLFSPQGPILQTMGKIAKFVALLARKSSFSGEPS
jgi:hypothetical protein